MGDTCNQQRSIKEIALWICNAVASENRITITNINSADHGCEAFSHGLYFLYDVHDEVAYIGMTATEKQSLYHRIQKNGNGAHKGKGWFTEIRYVKFHKFSKYDKRQLALAERIAIKEMNPRYNDKYVNPSNVFQFNWFE